MPENDLAASCSIPYNIIRPGNETYGYAELVADCKLICKREAPVAVLPCQRLNVPEIAAKLMISRRTVEFHIINIYES